jgi:uncharacterized protein (TIGR02145 family)
MGICEMFQIKIRLWGLFGVLGFALWLGACADNKSNPVDAQGNPQQGFKDPRDGQFYATTSLGEQIWMQGNLNFGDLLSTQSQPEDSLQQKYCYRNDLDSCAKYGGLYTWSQVFRLDSSCQTKACAVPDSLAQGICPPGWRVPSLGDYETLMQNLGGWETVGAKLQGENTWNLQFSLSGIKFAKGSSIGSVLQSGYYLIRPTTVTPGDSNQILVLLLSSASREVKTYRVDKTAGVSVKCLKAPSP